jgi:trehalose 6-phosphate synthase/phosphatase
VARVIVVSNRLPVTIDVEANAIDVRPSSGGLAAALRSVHARGDSLWLGWPGERPRMGARQQRELDLILAGLRAMPVHLSRDEVRGFYERIANGVLWPLLHYLADPLPTTIEGWEVYRAVNEKFARRVAELVEPTDLVWVHDFHLALVPKMLRELVPDARIGFFLHVPFPPPELFAIFPPRAEFIEGLLGADVVGFHTSSDVRAFTGAARQILRLDARYDGVSVEGRAVAFGAFPIGIDAQHWSELGSDDAVLRRAEEIREGAAHVFVGIDRLDYTKGILRRMLAFERLLESHQELRGLVRYIQVTVPSRERVEAFDGLRRRIDEAGGRVNSRFTTPTSVPIHRIHNSLSEEEVAALYRAADVMLVTPLRDGMNLVAKEFVASRNDGDGVLILSEFAGAGSELGEALHINPFDVDGVAETMHRALTLSADERRTRMAGLRSRIFANTVEAWADRYLAALGNGRERRSARTPGSAENLSRVVAGARARGVLLVLDYDGTLVPFAPMPDAAAPDRELLELLDRLAARKGTRVFIVSGRRRDSLERWLGHLDVGLQAEHGLWSRHAGAADWQPTMAWSTDWKPRVRTVFEQFVEMTHGAFIEDKTASIAWHYRCASGDHTDGLPFGEYQANELQMVLSDLLRNEPLEVLRGSKVVEVRPSGLHKGVGVPSMLGPERDAGEMILAFGDDATDEDLFGALSDGSLTVRVGDGPTSALYRVPSHEDVRRVLASLLD